ncbi:ALK and LTK ligand 2-like [Girardinichthys multiradiatus]|uniref:ALK and LTK ligand 2-like n=1 Tax=Girardinichthys multiradiatus TaxID=208333 RepID=UPI001FADCF31|nr:ALK and LTK ligand 2-like [Girardinichthys multiradiatus]
MSAPHKPVIVGLLLLLSTLTEHCGEGAPATAAGGDAQRNLRRMAEIMKHVEESRGRHAARTEAPLTPRAVGSGSAEHRDIRGKTDKGNQALALPPTDFKMKERIIKYFTGPLVFSSKCRKNAYRLYHHTRDCTLPAYFKRCARLLTRLAGSPQCTEG